MALNTKLFCWLGHESSSSTRMLEEEDVRSKNLIFFKGCNSIIISLSFSRFLSCCVYLKNQDVRSLQDLFQEYPRVWLFLKRVSYSESRAITAKHLPRDEKKWESR